MNKQLDRIKIVKSIENRLSSYNDFEARIINHLTINYFALVYQSLYNKMGYKKEENLFTNDSYKHFIEINNFLDLVNEIYRTRVSGDGIKIISDRIKEFDDFDSYDKAIRIFERCDPVVREGKLIIKSAYSLGTKILHFYDPEKNPILDQNVSSNVGINRALNEEICIEFREAAILFTDKYKHDYFEKFYTSSKLKLELSKRFMTTNFSTMEILDMALYETSQN